MSEDERVQIPSGSELLASFRALPPLAQVLDAAEGLVTDELYLVGGAVRDLIASREFLDVDLAIDGDPLALATALGEPEGDASKFGTLRVNRGGVRYDLARTRTERYAHPGALPEVRPAGIDADLERRDFTVNAIAVGLMGGHAGELIAADAALEDLAAMRLAVLHDTSFEDDPTRLLRIVRYVARLGFEVAPHTRTLAERAIGEGALDTISGTRLGNELRLLALEADPVTAFQTAAALGLPWSLDSGLAGAALDALPADGRPDLLVLATVFAGVPYDQLTHELDRLGFTAHDRDAITEASTQAAGLARRLSRARSGSEIARAAGSARVATMALASALGPPEAPRRWLSELRDLKLDITGEDLIDNGVPEGPAIGHALSAARDALLDGLATDRASQLKIALKAAE